MKIKQLSSMTATCVHLPTKSMPVLISTAYKNITTHLYYSYLY